MFQVNLRWGWPLLEADGRISFVLVKLYPKTITIFSHGRSTSVREIVFSNELGSAEVERASLPSREGNA